ncbi:MAG TPA: chorismate mutase [Azospirillaceae bacterium]|nr:chorismate mutase [Azospirillaceae bacterium]
MSSSRPSAGKPTIEELRREIDEIDDTIHDLLMRRTLVAERIGAVKGSQERVFLRPGREAVILRRLVARHTGNFPLGALVRIWREMIATLTRLQGPFAVSVYAPEDRRGFWDVARDHFGSFTPMTPVPTAITAVRAVTDGTAAVGVVPVPAEDDADPWWRLLMSNDGKTPRVVARLPFGGRGNGRGDDGDAFAIALVPNEPTGDDRTLVAVELVADISRGRLKDTFDACGLPAVGFVSWFARDSVPGSLLLVEIADFVDAHDPRLGAFADRLSEFLSRLNVIGGYAVPLTLPHDTKKG